MKEQKVPKLRNSNLCALLTTLFLLVMAAGCQQTSLSNLPDVTLPPSDAGQEEKDSGSQAQTELSDAEEDVVGQLIENIEKDDLHAARPVPPPEDEITTLSNSTASQIDSIKDERKKLAEQALNAALGLLSTKKTDSLSPLQPFSTPQKSANHLRVGVLLPLSGEYGMLGRDIASGIEMALFQLSDPQIELIYFDTADTLQAEQIARQAIATEIDIIIGPLFTQTANKMRVIFAGVGLPVLSLSNNLQLAAPGQWVLGYLPEQQIDHLLGFAIANNKTRIAILASEDTFGQRLLTHANSRLNQFGLTTAETMILTQQTLMDEDSLKDAIRRFTRYQKTDEDSSQLPPAAYDALILAGNPSFVLTVAPLLSYYDMDPNRVIFLGTDLWARSELLTEPSMQGALVTQATKPNNMAFEKRYQRLFDKPTNDHVRLGFDAFALIAVARRGLLENPDQLLNSPIDWRANLIRKEGFEGLSGRFNLLPDGLNQRFYGIYRIEDNQLVSFSSP